MSQSDESETTVCQNCGDAISKEDAVRGSGSTKDGAADLLSDGGSVRVSEVFEFDDLYCSMDCLLNGGDA